MTAYADDTLVSDTWFTCGNFISGLDASDRTGGWSYCHRLELNPSSPAGRTSVSDVKCN